jgi:hypothetical protein
VRMKRSIANYSIGAKGRKSGAAEAAPPSFQGRRLTCP